MADIPRPGRGAGVRSRFALVKDPQFRSMWFTGGLAGVTRWLEVLAVAVFTFDVTRSPFMVALMLVVRILPIFLLSALVGAVAERLNRKVMLGSALGVLTVTSGVLSWLAATGQIELWHIGIGAVLNGIYFSGEHAVRRTMLGEIVGTERVGTALALDTITNNATRGLGPLIGGLLLEFVGLEGTYLIGAILQGVAAILVWRLHYRPGNGQVVGLGIFTIIADGVRAVRGNRVLTGVLVVTVVANVFGFPVTSMVPVLGREELGLSKLMTGVLAAAEGCGSLTGALIIAAMAQSDHYKRVFYFGVIGFITSVLAFALVESFGIGFVMLYLGGYGMAGFAAMQSTLMYLNAPPEMRSRVMGLLSMCIGTGPIGMLHVGVMANWLGTAEALKIMACEGLLLLAICGMVWPEFWRRAKP